MTFRTCMLLAGVTLGLAGCEPQELPREPDSQSEYVDLYLDEGLQVCAGTLDAYDAFIERAFDLWTGEAPGDFVAPVHVLHDSVCSHGGSCIE